MQNTLIVAKRLFSSGLNKHADLMYAALVVLSQKPRIKAVFLIKNRAQFHAIFMPLFNELSSNHRVTHCYFHNLNRTLF